MKETIEVKISTDDLNIQEACDFVSDPAYGAIDTFIGIVRNNHVGKEVTGITYDVHEKLAEKTLLKICEDAQQKWGNTKYYIAHYQGELSIGDMSVIIAVGSEHRAASFDACRFIIEEIKKRTPVWKKEHYLDGKSEWLPGYSLRDNAA